MVQQHRRWELPADPHHIGAVRRQVASFAARAGMPATAVADLQFKVHRCDRGAAELSMLFALGRG